MNKRQFLKASLASIGALTTSSGLAGQLQIVNSMAEVNSAQRFGDHKAMVCIFLYGGHDSFNLVVSQVQVTIIKITRGQDNP